MNEAQARTAVNTAALIVAGLYFYRKLVEPALGGGAAAQPSSVTGAAGQVVGFGPLASTGRFIVGFGFVFLVLSAAEGAAPSVAGGMAALVALSAILGNGQQVASDLHRQLTAKPGGRAAVTPTVRVPKWENAIFPQRA